MRILLLMLLLTVNVCAQSAAPKTAADSFTTELAEAERQSAIYGARPTGYPEYAGASKKVQELYQKAVANPELMDALILSVAMRFAELKESAKSAPQVSQVAEETSVRLQFILIQQNARIIKLLEQLSRK